MCVFGISFLTSLLLTLSAPIPLTPFTQPFSSPLPKISSIGRFCLAVIQKKETFFFFGLKNWAGSFIFSDRSTLTVVRERKFKPLQKGSAHGLVLDGV